MSDLTKLFKEMQFANVQQEGMTYNGRVLLVDALNTFVRSYAAIPTLNDNGNHVGRGFCEVLVR